jgi:hypothetical protein
MASLDDILTTQKNGVVAINRIVQAISSSLVATDGPTFTGYIKVTPVLVANLPSAVTAGAGARAFVTNATATTFASAVVGGGANNVPVYSDGTVWRIG